MQRLVDDLLSMLPAMQLAFPGEKKEQNQPLLWSQLA
jgi:hypothetical protein